MSLVRRRAQRPSPPLLTESRAEFRYRGEPHDHLGEGPVVAGVDQESETRSSTISATAPSRVATTGQPAASAWIKREVIALPMLVERTTSAACRSLSVRSRAEEVHGGFETASRHHRTDRASSGPSPSERQAGLGKRTDDLLHRLDCQTLVLPQVEGSGLENENSVGPYAELVASGLNIIHVSVRRSGYAIVNDRHLLGR